MHILLYRHGWVFPWNKKAINMAENNSLLLLWIYSQLSHVVYQSSSNSEFNVLSKKTLTFSHKVRFKTETRTTFTWGFKFFSAVPDENGYNIQSVQLPYFTLMLFHLLSTSISKQSFEELDLSEDKGKQEKLKLKVNWTKYGSSSWKKISTLFWYFLEVVFFLFFSLHVLYVFFFLFILSKKGKCKEKKKKSDKECKRTQICCLFFLKGTG